MRKKTIIRSSVVAATTVALAAGGFMVAGSASAAESYPEIAPAISIGQVEQASIMAAGGGVVTDIALDRATKRNPITWVVKVQDGTRKYQYKYNAETGEALANRDAKDPASALRRVIAEGYSGENSVPIKYLEMIALQSAQGGYVRDAELKVKTSKRTLEMVMTVEQGKKDPKVTIDVATMKVVSVK